MTLVSRRKTDLLEAFGLWANRHGVTRFWGVVKTGDGRIALLLPTSSADYSAIVTAGPGHNSGSIYLVLGQNTAGAPSIEHLLGRSSDPPADLLVEAATWLMASARGFTLVDMNVTAYEASHVASRIAHYMHDPVMENEALAIRNSITV